MQKTIFLDKIITIIIKHMKKKKNEKKENDDFKKIR